MSLTDPETGVGEGDLALAEEAAEARAAAELAHCRLMLALGRMLPDEVDAKVSDLPDATLGRFSIWLEGETRLSESGPTFYNLVLGICGAEMINRWMESHGQKGEPKV